MSKYSIFLKKILTCGVLTFSFSVQSYADQNELSAQTEASNAAQTLPLTIVKESCSKPIEKEMEITKICKYMSTSTDFVYKQMLNRHVGRETASVLKKKLPTKNLKYDVENNEHSIISVE